MLWETGGDSSTTACACSVIAADLPRPSKTIPTLGPLFAYFKRGPIDDVKASHMATSKADNEVKQQAGFVSADPKSATTALNDLAGLRERVAVEKCVK